MSNDPIVEETRKTRNRLAAKFKYDVKSLGAYYQAMQKAENRVVVTRRPKLISGSVKLVSPKFAASPHANGRRAKTSRHQQAVAAALS